MWLADLHQLVSVWLYEGRKGGGSSLLSEKDIWPKFRDISLPVHWTLWVVVCRLMAGVQPQCLSLRLFDRSLRGHFTHIFKIAYSSLQNCVSWKNTEIINSHIHPVFDVQVCCWNQSSLRQSFVLLWARRLDIWGLIRGKRFGSIIYMCTYSTFSLACASYDMIAYSGKFHFVICVPLTFPQ